ncbi:YbbC/YhhH family protein [Enterobacter sp.]|uniref:YbbC/YhhH family protein n=1 Tax=Enterobacter sp. TaxID=42895 RepID=UPI00399523F3
MLITAIIYLFITSESAISSSNIEILRKYGKEDKYAVRDLVKSHKMAMDIAEIYVSYRYGKKYAEEEKPYKVTEFITSWVVEGTMKSDKIAGGVFVIEINKNDGKILNFGHGK